MKQHAYRHIRDSAVIKEEAVRLASFAAKTLADRYGDALDAEELAVYAKAIGILVGIARTSCLAQGFTEAQFLELVSDGIEDGTAFANDLRGQHHG